MTVRSPGLRRPRIAPEVAKRLPPGQFPSSRWPVLHEGEIPTFEPASWDFRAFGLVARPLRVNWAEFQELPRATVSADLHCVSRWSKLDNLWEGVPFRAILDLVEPSVDARFVVFHCDGGYSANLPLADLQEDDVILALKQNGEVLTPEHGFPLRAIVVDRFAWKSAKWLRAIEFLADDRPGFWERFGYHGNGDVWKEERFAE